MPRCRAGRIKVNFGAVTEFPLFLSIIDELRGWLERHATWFYSRERHWFKAADLLEQPHSWFQGLIRQRIEACCDQAL
jgi:hypothetical protein